MTNATTHRRAHPLAPTAFDPATSPVGAGSSSTSSGAGVLLALGPARVHTRRQQRGRHEEPRHGIQARLAQPVQHHGRHGERDRQGERPPGRRGRAGAPDPRSGSPPGSRPAEGDAVAGTRSSGAPSRWRHVTSASSRVASTETARMTVVPRPQDAPQVVQHGPRRERPHRQVRDQVPDAVEQPDGWAEAGHAHTPTNERGALQHRGRAAARSRRRYLGGPVGPTTSRGHAWPPRPQGPAEAPSLVHGDAGLVVTVRAPGGSPCGGRSCPAARHRRRAVVRRPRRGAGRAVRHPA